MVSVSAPSLRQPSAGRILAIDLARGAAVALMILSHTVKGLLGFEQIPAWGMVPIHLVTKFSSSLFILVFGVALGVAFLPHVGTPRWPEKRRKLLLRGLVVFFWYKVLTIAEMIHLHTPEEILDVLLYQGFPVYVEILGFYALALMWVPFALPLWKKAPLAIRAASPFAVAAVAYYLSLNFGFWGSDVLKALLVEHEDYYTWGQLSRAPLVFIGLLIGQAVYAPRLVHRRRYVTGALLACALVMLGAFALAVTPSYYESLMAIAHNEGKHPPELPFMLFSVGGAFLLLSLALLGGNRLAKVLRPVTIVGSNALQSFIFHIFVLFVVVRFLLDLWLQISYGDVLALAMLLILATALWIKSLTWVQAQS